MILPDVISWTAVTFNVGLIGWTAWGVRKSKKLIARLTAQTAEADKLLDELKAACFHAEAKWTELADMSGFDRDDIKRAMLHGAQAAQDYLRELQVMRHGPATFH